jgi:hypothetical protein
MLLVPSDQLRHRFRTILASPKTTRSLRATQEAHSHVDFQAVGLEALVISDVGPFMSPAFSRQVTPDSVPFMYIGFHAYLTVGSEWTTDAELPSLCDKWRERLQNQKSILRGRKRGPAGA